MPLRQLHAVRGVPTFYLVKIQMDKYDFGAFYCFYFGFWFYSKYTKKEMVFWSSNFKYVAGSNDDLRTVSGFGSRLSATPVL